jgi:hypothetical protein
MLAKLWRPSQRNGSGRKPRLVGDLREMPDRHVPDRVNPHAGGANWQIA